MPKHILIVDDDQLIRKGLTLSLRQADYDTSTAGTAEEALAAVSIHPPDLILLDIGLPGMDGLDALRSFRQQVSTPIIFITARRSELDQVVGLELGADDYIIKPFETSVLLAHIKAVLRRSSQSKPSPQEPIVIGDLRIDPIAHTAQVGNRTVELQPKEFNVLLALAQEAGHVVSVDDLLNRVWGAD
jgi:DNA-binding response OmpR family regulator